MTSPPSPELAPSPELTPRPELVEGQPPSPELAPRPELVEGPRRILITRTADTDLPQLLRLETAGFPRSEQWAAPSWRSQLDGPSFCVLLARDADAVVGAIALRFAGDGCELDRIVVDPERRRQGIGRLLLDAGLDAADAAGATEMILEVRSDHTAAIGLYRDYGFRAWAVRRDYYGPGRDAMIMKLTRGGGRWPDR